MWNFVFWHINPKQNFNWLIFFKLWKWQCDLGQSVFFQVAALFIRLHYVCFKVWCFNKLAVLCVLCWCLNIKYKYEIWNLVVMLRIYCVSRPHWHCTYCYKCTKHQFIHLLTATFKDLHIKNSKNYKRWYCPHHTDCVSMCWWIIIMSAGLLVVREG